MKLLLLIFVLIHQKSYGITPTTDNKLIFVHTLFRHGQRSPVESYPKDPYKDLSHWPVAWGELTNTGKQQQYELGQWLRQRYNDYLINDVYSTNDIYIQSDDSERVMESVYVNLAGLYPAKGLQIWNDELLWQPIPVHTNRLDTKYLLDGVLPHCPAYELAKEKLANSSEFQELEKRFKPFYDNLANCTGYNIDSGQGIMTTNVVRDILFIQNLFDKTPPEWTNGVFPSDDIDEISLYYYKIPSYTTELAKLRSGYLLKTILDRSTTKSDGNLKPDRKIWMYGSHDTVLASLLYAMGLFDDKFVNFAACLLFEVWNGIDGPALRIFYRNPSTVLETDAVPLYIPNCGYSCPLVKMFDLYKEIIPTKDFEVACKI